MARIQPDARLDQLLSAAARVFMSRGYQRTAMADIAREMGVAAGTLYLYVESKEALFHLLAARTLVKTDAALPELPVKTPPPGATIHLLRQAMVLEAYAPRLSAALAKPGAAADFDDLERVVGELYDSAYDHRVGINLVERSAIDWPDLARVFYEGFRPQLLEALERYLERGIALGALRPAADLAVAARFIVETIAWFAIHRHGDPGPEAISDEAAREGVIDLIAASIRMRPEQGPREESRPRAAPRG